MDHFIKENKSVSILCSVVAVVTVSAIVVIVLSAYDTGHLYGSNSEDFINTTIAIATGPEDIAGTKTNALDEDLSSGFTITVFAYNNFGEPSFTVQNINKCLTLPEDWHRRVSSVNTGGNCVEICPYAACSGQCMILSPGSLGHNRLRDINFDKRITSVRPCPS